MSKADIKKELATRELERRHADKRESLVKFMEYMWEQEKGTPFQVPKYYYEIEGKLNKMLKGEITRLIINVPPRTGKTLMITEMFPIWAMGNNHATEFIATGFSTSLTREFSGHARDWYISPAYKNVFPRVKEIRDDQNTKEYWKDTDNKSYYATGTGGTITGRGCDIMIIDDPIKPDEADTSELKRENINTWFLNTIDIGSRFNNPEKGGIIIIMQRTHDNDLCGFLEERIEKGLDSWEKIVVPAIDDDGNSLEPNRFPIKMLKEMERKSPIVFSTQYMQQPSSALTQEIFPDEWSVYFEHSSEGNLYAIVDPAFSEKKNADYSVIAVGRPQNGLLDIEDISSGKQNVNDLVDRCVQVARKWRPIKFGVESYGAQKAFVDLLTKKFREEGIFTTVEAFTQQGTKHDKIRANLINPMRSGKIRFKRGLENLETLHKEMRSFPRGAHDDHIDAIQMLWSLCDLQPHIQLDVKMPEYNFDAMGRPVYNSNSDLGAGNQLSNF